MTRPCLFIWLFLGGEHWNFTTSSSLAHRVLCNPHPQPGNICVFNFFLNNSTVPLGYLRWEIRVAFSRGKFLYPDRPRISGSSVSDYISKTSRKGRFWPGWNGFQSVQLQEGNPLGRWSKQKLVKWIFCFSFNLSHTLVSFTFLVWPFVVRRTLNITH